MQKVLFYDTAERVASFLRPHWTLAVNGRATVVQALPEMMEILPAGASKGTGVQRLLDHLGVPIDQVLLGSFANGQIAGVLLEISLFLVFRFSICLESLQIGHIE